MRTWQAALTGVAAAALLSACGGGFAEESPEAIGEAAEKDMKALESVRIAGELTSDGEEISVDMALTTDGDCQGTLGIQGGSTEIRSLGGETWMKPDAAFWEASAGEQAALIQGVVGDKWVVLGDDQDFAELCDLDELLDQMGGDDDDSKAETDGTEDVDGTEAVKVVGETDEGDPVTVWVKVDEPHHILKMQVTEGGEPGEITFSDFDEKLEVEAPADDEVVDLEQLGSQAG
ncbi:hypothetical protein [Nocardioides caldifontis]|uniref:hypothetical protein n=1 Tax=Nocardioides caldifontis TaxID=2588938 RepID=UPI0011E04D2A|nr:hypothetical protein [Nocardioides caldifontis]